MNFTLLIAYLISGVASILHSTPLAFRRGVGGEAFILHFSLFILLPSPFGEGLGVRLFLAFGEGLGVRLLFFILHFSLFILLPSPFGERLGVRLSFKILSATHNINALFQWL